MQWHVHENLCWGLNDDGEPEGRRRAPTPTALPTGPSTPAATTRWCTCGSPPTSAAPFAALEGHGAGQAARPTAPASTSAATTTVGGRRTATSPPTPYDPTKPIDLSGRGRRDARAAGVRREPRRHHLVELPQWADPAVAEAAGFHSIGDAAPGHEHYIQWDWIDDDVWLDPDHPESLVYEPQPTGPRSSCRRCSCCPPTVALDDVPDLGGALMQWHIHDNLCFTDDPVAPQVARLTRPEAPAGHRSSSSTRRR